MAWRMEIVAKIQLWIKTLLQSPIEMPVKVPRVDKETDIRAALSKSRNNTKGKREVVQLQPKPTPLVIKGLHKQNPQPPAIENGRVTKDNRVRVSAPTKFLSEVTLCKTAKQEKLAIEQNIEDTSM